MQGHQRANSNNDAGAKKVVSQVGLRKKPVAGQLKSMQSKPIQVQSRGIVSQSNLGTHHLIKSLQQMPMETANGPMEPQTVGKKAFSIPISQAQNKAANPQGQIDLIP